MDKGTVSALTFFCFFTLVSGENYDSYNEELIGRVIHVESLIDRGHWLTLDYNRHDSDGAYYLYFHDLPERLTYSTDVVQFMVHECKLDDVIYVCLESLAKRDYYLGAGYPPGEDIKTVKLQYTSWPYDNDGFYWIVLCTSESMNMCKMKSLRFEDEEPEGTGEWYIIKDGWQANMGKDSPTSSELRIHAPEPTDGMVEIYSMTNNGDTEQSSTYSYTVGITTSSSSSSEITTSASIEVESAFRVFSAEGSISSTWAESSSEIFSSSKTVSLDLTIPPRTKVVLKQRKGNYAGEYDVGEDDYDLEEISLDGGETRTTEVKFVRQKQSTKSRNQLSPVQLCLKSFLNLN